jgi:collagenase-like PrtC family protease
MLRETCKKNQFKLGVNFDDSLLNIIIKLNNESQDNKITELYGSIAKHAELTARPDFRLPDVGDKQLEEYVNIAKANGIDFNYTLNSFMPYGSKVELNKNLNYIIDLVNYLESIGIYRLTIANPIMLEVIRKYARSKIEIELSTCAHVDTLTQIKYYHEKYGVNKICGNLNKNRDFKFLSKAAEYCKKNGIIYELMANEFCGVGGEGYATHCIYRDSCYMCHATNHTYGDSVLLNNYPMDLCTKARGEDPANWLRLKWIRPEDLRYYNAIGLKHFKITGRTGSTQYISETIRSYLEESYNGNLLNLWKPLESIKADITEAQVSKVDIPNKKLDKFIYPWIEGKNCDYEVCGETCNYCKNFYDMKGI